jgi:signal peptidase I
VSDPGSGRVDRSGDDDPRGQDPRGEESRGEDEPSQDPADDGKRSRAGGALRETAILVVIALAISVLIRTFVVQAFYIPSESMVPSLQINDRVLVSKLTTQISGVHRGQVVVFQDPGGWLPPAFDTAASPQRWIRHALTFVGLLPADTGEDLVKRVIGVSGDRVRCCTSSGQISVNGVALTEPYVAGAPNDAPAGCLQQFDVTVPKGRVWVMGDNRAVSQDSRCHADDALHGFVPADNVIGRAFVIVWPVSHWSLLRVPDTFHQKALHAGNSH